jgi:hypothetical protein
MQQLNLFVVRGNPCKIVYLPYFLSISEITVISLFPPYSFPACHMITVCVCDGFFLALLILVLSSHVCDADDREVDPEEFIMMMNTTGFRH